MVTHDLNRTQTDGKNGPKQASQELMLNTQKCSSSPIIGIVYLLRTITSSKVYTLLQLPHISQIRSFSANPHHFHPGLEWQSSSWYLHNTKIMVTSRATPVVRCICRRLLSQKGTESGAANYRRETPKQNGAPSVASGRNYIGCY